jgi:hypothetical protein
VRREHSAQMATAKLKAVQNSQDTGLQRIEMTLRARILAVGLAVVCHLERTDETSFWGMQQGLPWSRVEVVYVEKWEFAIFDHPISHIR